MVVSPEIEGLLAASPGRELGGGDVVTPAQLDGVCLLVVGSGVARVRAEPPRTVREGGVCHAGSEAVVLPPRDLEVLAALVPTRIVLLSTERRDELLELPGAAAALFDALGETIRQKHRTIEALAHHHHLDRVRAKLLQLAAAHGVVGRDGIRLDLPLTHELLGEMTGSARETVTRAIDELQNEGLIARRGRSYLLLVDPNELPA